MTRISLNGQSMLTYPLADQHGQLNSPLSQTGHENGPPKKAKNCLLMGKDDTF